MIQHQHGNHQIQHSRRVSGHSGQLACRQDDKACVRHSILVLWVFTSKINRDWWLNRFSKVSELLQRSSVFAKSRLWYWTVDGQVPVVAKAQTTPLQPISKGLVLIYVTSEWDNTIAGIFELSWTHQPKSQWLDTADGLNLAPLECTSIPCCLQCLIHPKILQKFGRQQGSIVWIENSVTGRLAGWFISLPSWETRIQNGTPHQPLLVVLRNLHNAITAYMSKM